MFLVSVEYIPTAPEMGDGEEEQGFYFGGKPDASCKISNSYWAGKINTAVFHFKFSADCRYFLLVHLGKKKRD